PYWSNVNSPNTDQINRLIGSISLDYNFLNDFTLSYKLGTDYYTENNKKITGTGSFVEKREDGYISQFHRYHNRFTSNLFLTYNKDLSDDFNLNLMVGNSVEELNQKTTSLTGDAFQAPGIYSIGNVTKSKQAIDE